MFTTVYNCYYLLNLLFFLPLLRQQVLLDLVQGEFMQMGSKEDESERFSHYIHKSFKKTASLIAYTCKAVALLSGANQSYQEAAFQYGRNLGIAFQLVDDLLDFVSSQAELGKPAATDLKLGLATAPVLFACEKFPELNVMIMRRFSEPGDVERAYDFVMKVSFNCASFVAWRDVTLFVTICTNDCFNFVYFMTERWT